MEIADMDATGVADDLVDNARGAFEVHLPAILAVPDRDVVRNHTGVERAIRLGLEASSLLGPYVDRLARFPGFSSTVVDMLAGLTKALYFAVGERRRNRRDRRRQSALLGRGYKARNKLGTLAKLLVIDGMLTEDLVPSLDGGNGYLALSSDVTDLVEMFETHLPDLEIGGLLPEAEIEAMKSLAGQLYSAPSKDRIPGQDHGFDEIIAKGYTCLKKVYSKLRRAMLFLLEDVSLVDAVIPPFVTERSTRSSGAARSELAEAEIVEAAPTAGDEEAGGEAPGGAIEVARSVVASEAALGPMSRSSTPVAGEAPGCGTVVASGRGWLCRTRARWRPRDPPVHGWVIGHGHACRFRPTTTTRGVSNLVIGISADLPVPASALFERRLNRRLGASRLAGARTVRSEVHRGRARTDRGGRQEIDDQIQSRDLWHARQHRNLGFSQCLACRRPIPEPGVESVVRDPEEETLRTAEFTGGDVVRALRRFVAVARLRQCRLHRARGYRAHDEATSPAADPISRRRSGLSGPASSPPAEGRARGDHRDRRCDGVVVARVDPRCRARHH